MARLSKFARSQKAHSRLKTKHTYTPGVKGEILMRYHNNILNIQDARKCVIPKKERQAIYKKVSERYSINSKQRKEKESNGKKKLFKKEI